MEFSFNDEINMLDWLDGCSEHTQKLISEFVKNDPKPIFYFEFKGTAVYPVIYTLDTVEYVNDEHITVNVKHLFDEESIATLSDELISNYVENQYERYVSSFYG